MPNPRCACRSNDATASGKPRYALELSGDEAARLGRLGAVAEQHGESRAAPVERQEAQAKGVLHLRGSGRAERVRRAVRRAFAGKSSHTLGRRRVVFARRGIRG